MGRFSDQLWGSPGDRPHTGLSWISGEYLLSGRVFDIAATLGLSTVVAIVLRNRGVSWALVGALLAAPLLTEPGLETTLGLRHDTLPVLLQFGGLALVERGRGRNWPPIVAGILCGLAVLSKLSALWALTAIVIWLLLRRQARSAFVVVAGAITVALAGGMAVNAVSEGRFMLGLLTPGLLGEATAGIPPPLPGLPRLVEQLYRTSPFVVLLLPFAVTGLSLPGWRRPIGLYVIATGIAFVELIVVFGDRGVFGNHIVPLLYLVPLAAVLTTESRIVGTHRLRAVASVALVIGMAVSFQANAASDLMAVVQGRVPAPSDRYPPLAERVAAAGSILSEDPGVETFNGRLPTILDPYMLRRVAQDQPELVEPVVDRIIDREFDLVVTLFALPSAPHWYREYHLGVEVTDALLQHYSIAGTDAGYVLYVPRN